MSTESIRIDPAIVREIARDARAIAIRRGAAESVEAALIASGVAGPVVGEKFDAYSAAVGAEYERLEAEAAESASGTLTGFTRQTAAPLEHTHLASTLRQARELARNVVRGDIDIDPPYQRGQVWTEDQRVALVRSWLLGLPTGVVILSDRAHSQWAGPDPDVDGFVWAVVDGKQRLSAAVAWFDDGFAVPASWIAPEIIDRTTDTDDGPYVHFSGLTVAGRRRFVNRALFAVAEFRSAVTTRDEAEIYLLVNGGGTMQTEADMRRARGHADADEES